MKSKAYKGRSTFYAWLRNIILDWKGDGVFSWLQLSDLHVGMSTQGWLWPTVRHALFEDIRRMYHAQGKWQLVIFSGDLVQSGSRKEFDKLDEILDELWTLFDDLGFCPALVTIPGNHDVTRSELLNPNAIALKHYWEEEDIRSSFFSGSSPYLTYCNSVLAEYRDWLDRRRSSHVYVLSGREGFLYGDQTFVIEAGAFRIGVVLLNSTWLQLSKGDFKGQLNIDLQQFHSIVESDAYKWRSENHANLIITHHPLDWLHSEAQKTWLSEVNPPGSFDLHLYGHMHLPAANSTSVGGSAPRTSVQAPSAFGLEYLADGSTERVHGYLIGKIAFDGDRKAIRIWPRILTTLKAGKRKFIADHDFDLDMEDAYWPSGFPVLAPGKISVSDLASEKPRYNLAHRTSPDDLKLRISHQFLDANAHSRVRQLEQQRCLSGLETSNIAWVVADWGMDFESFASTIHSAQRRPSFRIELGDFESKDQFLANMEALIGLGFERLLDILSDELGCFVVFDNVQVSNNAGAGSAYVEREIISFSALLKEFCPKIHILIHSRLAPTHVNMNVVELRPFDEADLRNYVNDHHLGGPQLAERDNIETLFRHTDGVPTRVDATLKQLQVITINELALTNSDYGDGVGYGSEVPAALPITINKLASGNDAERKALDLLCVLSAFPRGEQLTRIKRFDSIHPFHASHAAILLDARLIEANSAADFEVARSGPTHVTLVVPRIVRQWVREQQSAASISRMNKKAAELFFGPEWANGVLKPTSHYRFDNPQRSADDISNAVATVMRLLGETDANERRAERESVLNLVCLFLGALMKGDHFRSALNLCQDLDGMITETDPTKTLSTFSFFYAQSLRMIGDIPTALEKFKQVDEKLLSRNERQKLFVNLALALESERDIEGTTEAAKQALKIDRKSNLGLQAQGILFSQIEDDFDRRSRLSQLERKCRKKDADIVANNIALQLIEDSDWTAEERRHRLIDVIRSAEQTRELHTLARATVKFVRSTIASENAVRDTDLSRLIRSYHYAFVQRLSSMFDGLHDALMVSFALRKEGSNLLSLFRYSSLFWRLRGDESQERECVAQIGKLLDIEGANSIHGNDKQAAYYVSRAKILLPSVIPSPISG